MMRTQNDALCCGLGNGIQAVCEERSGRCRRRMIVKCGVQEVRWRGGQEVGVH